MSFYEHTFDKTLTNPGKKELFDVIAKARQIANGRCEDYLVYEVDSSTVLKKGEGCINSIGKSRTTANEKKRSYPVSVLGIAWFTDSSKNKIVRVIGSRMRPRANIWGLANVISKLSNKEVVLKDDSSAKHLADLKATRLEAAKLKTIEKNILMTMRADTIAQRFKIISELLAGKNTINDLKDATGISTGAIRNFLDILSKFNFIIKYSMGGGGGPICFAASSPYIEYAISPEGRAYIEKQLALWKSTTSYDAKQRNLIKTLLIKYARNEAKEEARKKKFYEKMKKWDIENAAYFKEGNVYRNKEYGDLVYVDSSKREWDLISYRPNTHLDKFPCPHLYGLHKKFDRKVSLNRVSMEIRKVIEKIENGEFESA